MAYEMDTPLFHRLLARLHGMVVAVGIAVCVIGTVGSMGLVGCYSLPAGRQAVDSVRVTDTSQVPRADVENKIATSPSPRFLGIWDGFVFQYAYYDRYVLQQDLERIERYYRARGYYSAKVRAARVIPTDKSGHVRVEISVTEGPPTIVRSVKATGLNTIPFEHQGAIINAMNRGIRVNQVFDEETYEDTKARLTATLMNRGFAWAEVKGSVAVDLLSQGATIEYKIQAGPLFYIRNIHFDGYQDLPLASLRRVFGIRPGDRFSAQDIELGKNALLDLGVLADVQVDWTQPSGSKDANIHQTVNKNKQGQPVVDLIVRCTPGPLQTVKLGIGTELDTLRTDIHALAGWESRNFLGGLRKFSITTKPGVVLYPTRVGRFDSPERLLMESRNSASLRQPGLIDARLTGVVRSSFAIYPVLLQTNTDNVILGYRELKAAVGLERPWLNNHLWLAAYFDIQAYYPFTYVGRLDDSLRRVFIRYLELIANLDFRDSTIRPHKGAFFGNSVQFAGGIFGGSVSDIKVQPELRLYAPISTNVTLAFRSTVGFLFPRDYGNSLDDELRPEDTRDQQLLYFRALFSGGPSSNRGYGYRGVGPHGPGAFLAPNMSFTDFRQSCWDNSNQDMCRIPLGGLTLWETSLEVRYPISGALTGAVFVDASDVTRQETAFSMLHPHVSVGPGIRYDTPVGPLRLDIGYRVPGLQNISSSNHRREHPSTFLGAPLALSIAIGQAF